MPHAAGGDPQLSANVGCLIHRLSAVFRREGKECRIEIIGQKLPDENDDTSAPEW